MDWLLYMANNKRFIIYLLRSAKYEIDYLMTPHQKHIYSILRDLSWEYDYTDGGKVYMNRWDRGSDGSSKLATIIIESNGNYYKEIIHEN